MAIACAHLSLAPAAMRRGFEWRTYWVAATITAAVLLSLVAIPQWLSRAARMQVLRTHVAQIANLAAATVDGDLHRKLIEAGVDDPVLYAQAVRPLVKFHSASDDLYYVYTMTIRAGEAYFVLDTANEPGLRTRRELKKSHYLEHFALHPEYSSDWLTRIAAGQTWTTPTFQHDDYGYFLSGHAPIYDSHGQFSGFVGVDFDVGYYAAQEVRFTWIAVGSLVAALLLSLLLAYFAARYHYQWQHRLALQYHSSMRDELTQALNRRGAYEAVSSLLRRRAASYAVILIDIDNFKHINDSYGHVAGDSVLMGVTAAMRECVRDGDVVARLGGDEFLVFAPDCDEPMARQLVALIQRRISERAHQHVCAFSISVGVRVEAVADIGFDEMYRRADEALYRAKAAGKNRFDVSVG